MKKILLITIWIILLRFIYTGYIGIIKPAVLKFSIKHDKYIICEYKLTSGFDWRMIQNEFGEENNEYIVLSIPDDEKHKVSINSISDTVKASGNKFVFYISDKYIGKNDIDEECLVYNVTSWDILYPIKRDRILGIFESSWVLTKNDTNTNINYNKIIYFIILIFTIFFIYRVINIMYKN